MNAKGSSTLPPLRSMLREWRWMLRYVRRYWAGVLVYILIGLLEVGLGLVISLAGKTLVDMVVAHDSSRIFGTVAGLALLTVGQLIAGAVTSRISAHIQIRVVNELREDMFTRLLSARWEPLEAYHSGEVLNRLEGDVNTVAGGVVGFVPTCITRAAQLLGVFCIIFYYDPMMALLSLLSAPVLLLIGRWTLRIMRKRQQEIRQVKAACGEHILKVIVETCLLTEEEKRRACRIVSRSGAEYIKTSTGFSTGGATREDVALFRQHVDPSVRIKAAGGIGSWQDAADFLALGADRLGTSRLVRLAQAEE